MINAKTVSTHGYTTATCLRYRGMFTQMLFLFPASGRRVAQNLFLFPASGRIVTQNLDDDDDQEEKKPLVAEYYTALLIKNDGYSKSPLIQPPTFAKNYGNAQVSFVLLLLEQLSWHASKGTNSKSRNRN